MAWSCALIWGEPAWISSKGIEAVWLRLLLLLLLLLLFFFALLPNVGLIEAMPPRHETPGGGLEEFRAPLSVEAPRDDCFSGLAEQRCPELNGFYFICIFFLFYLIFL